MKTLKTDCSIAALALTMSLLSLCSCAGPAKTLKIEPLHQDQNCPPTKAGLHLLESQNAVDNAIRPKLPTRFKEPKAESSDIDFQYWSQQHWLVLASIGQKPSGGFRIELTENTSTIKNKTLTLPVNILEPEKDSFQTMALTSPCLLMAIEKGEYSNIQLKKGGGWTINVESL